MYTSHSHNARLAFPEGSVTGYALIRSKVSFSRNLRAPPLVPRFYPHSEWAAVGPVHVEVRFQALIRHNSDGPGLLGAAI